MNTSSKAKVKKLGKKGLPLTTFNIKYHFFKTKKDKALQAENREKTKSQIKHTFTAAISVRYSLLNLSGLMLTSY